MSVILLGNVGHEYHNFGKDLRILFDLPLSGIARAVPSACGRTAGRSGCFDSPDTMRGIKRVGLSMCCLGASQVRA